MWLVALLPWAAAVALTGAQSSTAQPAGVAAADPVDAGRRLLDNYWLDRIDKVDPSKPKY